MALRRDYPKLFTKRFFIAQQDGPTLMLWRVWQGISLQLVLSLTGKPIAPGTIWPRCKTNGNPLAISLLTKNQTSDPGNVSAQAALPPHATSRR